MTLHEMMPLWVYLVSGLLGMVAHYVTKWAKGEIIGNLFSYLFLDKPKATVAALMAFLMSAAALLATGGISLSTEPMMLIGAGFGIGWTCDSGLNKGEKS